MTIDRIPRSVFDERFKLPEWRIIGHTLMADFVAPTFPAAVDFVREVTAAADAAAHHPDIDIRYPGRVRVTLTTHAAHGLTEADSALASAINAIAGSRGLTVGTAAVSAIEVAIDAIDIPCVLPFWKAVLGYVEEPTANPGDPVDALIDPMRIGPSLWFQQMDEPRPQRNRVHFDLELPHDLVEDRLQAAVAAGGTVLTAEYARAFWVLADPEGNEVCLCTWQDRD